ncbi:MAG: DUF4192 family protein [Pseudonocardiaceae bacterium]|nr:DUF4192 family protein [Pseudonocardiaceae bacterium]
MSAPPATRVRLSDPAELIAAVPHLLGFHPRDSLVVITLQGRRLGLTLRTDLVAEGSEEQLAEQLLVPIARQRPSGAIVLIVGGRQTEATDLPHRPVVDALDDALAAADIPVVHAAWAASTSPGAAWRCYDEAGCAGTVADPDRCAIAAASVAAGVVTFDTREQLAELLAPDVPTVLARRARMLDADDAQHPLDTATVRERRALLGRLHADAAAGALCLDDRTVVEAASALCDHRIRDACLGWSAGDGAAAAEQLWLALVRATPAPQRSEPATLLGLAAYLRGDGALAGMALQAALDAHPDHCLAGLLRAALDGGLEPATLHSIAADAAVDARSGLGAAGDGGLGDRGHSDTGRLTPSGGRNPRHRRRSR